MNELRIICRRSAVVWWVQRLRCARVGRVACVAHLHVVRPREPRQLPEHVTGWHRAVYGQLGLYIEGMHHLHRTVFVVLAETKPLFVI